MNSNFQATSSKIISLGRQIKGDPDDKEEGTGSAINNAVAHDTTFSKFKGLQVTLGSVTLSENSDYTISGSDTVLLKSAPITFTPKMTIEQLILDTLRTELAALRSEITMLKSEVQAFMEENYLSDEEQEIAEFVSEAFSVMKTEALVDDSDIVAMEAASGEPAADPTLEIFGVTSFSNYYNGAYITLDPDAEVYFNGVRQANGKMELTVKDYLVVKLYGDTFDSTLHLSFEGNGRVSGSGPYFGLGVNQTIQIFDECASLGAYPEIPNNGIQATEQTQQAQSVDPNQLSFNFTVENSNALEYKVPNSDYYINSLGSLPPLSTSESKENTVFAEYSTSDNVNKLGFKWYEDSKCGAEENYATTASIGQQLGKSVTSAELVELLTNSIKKVAESCESDKDQVLHQQCSDNYLTN